MLAARRKPWNKDIISPTLDVKIISDMRLLLYLLGVSTWKNVIHDGFPYSPGKDGNDPIIDCKVAARFFTSPSHLSHKISEVAYFQDTYPKVEGLGSKFTAAKRADTARIMMKDYHDHCVLEEICSPVITSES